MGVNTDTIVEVKIVYEANDCTLMNVVHYKPGIPVAGPEEGILDNFAVVFGDSGAGTLLGGMKNLQSELTVYDEFTLQIVYPIRFAVRHYDLPLTGTISGTVSRQNSAITVAKKGRMGNRHNIGAFHLGGVADFVFKTGGFDYATFGAEFGALEAGLLHKYVDPLNSTEWFPYILNKEPIPDTDPVKYRISGATQVVEVETNDFARVMYRRTKGVGI